MLLGHLQEIIMRKKIFTLLLLVFTTSLFGFSGVTGKAELDANTKYVYRGVVHSDNLVLQPKGYLSFYGFRAKLFNNITVLPDNGKKILDATHFTLRYDIKALGFNLTPGIKYYKDWNNDINTAEISMGISYTLEGHVGLYSTHYLDMVKDFGKYYGNVGMAFKMDNVIPSIGIEGYMDINWQKPYFNDDSKFIFPYSLNIAAAAKFKPLSYVYVKGHANMSILLTEEAKHLNSDKTNIIYLGVTGGIEF